MSKGINRLLEAMEGLIGHTHRLEAEVGGRDYLPSVELQQAENALEGYRAESQRSGDVRPASDVAIKESVLAAVPTAEATPERGRGGRE